MLIITSLVVVLLLLSTVVYVTEIEKNAPVFVADANSGLFALKQAAVHTLVSALGNVSKGGDPNILAENLNRFKSSVESHSYNAILDLNFTMWNAAPYSDGFWINWGNNGESISSISALFALNSTGNSANYYSEFAINISSSISVSGTYASLNASHYQVTVTCNILNEGKPASINDITLYYKQNDPAVWTPATPTNIIDWGNGTYLTSFQAQNINQNNPLPISANCIDTRAISMWTNTTCTYEQ